jgi:hypothetical protein
MTVRSLYPADRPNLLLNFARARAIDTRVSFTRASTALYDGADGLIKTAKINEARFSSNPITGEGLGLVVEDAKTNQLPYSQQFDLWESDPNAPVTANTIAAPDGTTTADTLVENGAPSEHKRNQNNSTNGNTTYTASCYAKAAGRDWIGINMTQNTTSFVLATFNLTGDGTTTIRGSFGFTNNSARIQRLPNGWYRCSVTFTTDTKTSGTNAIYITPLPNNFVAVGSEGQQGYQGVNDLDALYVWGAQIELGPLSSYIPTGASSVTRAADVVTLEEPHFSNIWNPSGGTFLINYTTPAAGINPILSVDNNTTSNRIELYTSGTNQKFTVTSGGATQCDLTTGTVAANTIYRLSAAYASNDFSSVLNGAAPVTAGTGTVPTVNRLRIGSNQAGNFAVSTIARIAYYPNRYPNTQLRGLTTT